MKTKEELLKKANKILSDIFSQKDKKQKGERK